MANPAASFTALLFAALTSHTNTISFFNDNGRQFQGVELLTNGGAECRLLRDGELLGLASVSPDREKGLSNVIEIDLTKSKADILVVCKRGNQAISKTIQFGRQEWESINAPVCKVWESQSAKDKEPRCLVDEPSNSHWIQMQYPEIVRLLFKPHS